MAEDLIVDAATTLTAIEVYHSSVLNPYNFVALCMLEHALPYSGDCCVRVQKLLIGLYTKLGLLDSALALEKATYKSLDPASRERLKTHTLSLKENYASLASYSEQVSRLRSSFKL